MSAQRPLLEIAEVTKRFGPIAAVDGLSLGVQENEFFALLGPSGCGKTTLLRLIAGFEVPHCHVHVIPTMSMADLDFANAAIDPDPADLDAAADALRAALRSAGRTEVPAS